ncbi:MAG: LamG-like jellyroll fold domain-containing protein [Elusimicrobiota bacterium]
MPIGKLGLILSLCLGAASRALAAAPAAVTDLWVSATVSTGLGASSMSVTLEWTAPEDDGGDLTGYFSVRWSTAAPITDDAGFDSANYALDIPTTAVRSARQSVRIDSLDATTTHYFVIKSTDSEAAPQTSDLSNGATGQAYALAVLGTEGGTWSVAWGDYDNDGLLDLAASTGSVNIFLIHNAGSWTFTTSQIAGTNWASRGIAWGDYDKDGDLDLAVATDGDEHILQNDGSGSFSDTGALIGAGGDSHGIAWGDFDNDGDLDLAVANGGIEDEYVARNNGDGTFTIITLTGSGGNSTGIAWGDYDGDGDLDLGVANDSYGDEKLLRNDGSGAFAVVTPAATAANSSGAAWADYDNDGDLDLLVVNTLGNTFILRNNGGSPFDQVTPPNSNNASAVSWADYDDDGDLDYVLVGNGAGNKSLMRNGGSGSFSRQYLPGAAGSSLGVSWGDADNDGDLDLAVSNASADNLYVIRNDSGIAHAAPAAPSSGFSASFSEYEAFSASGVLTLSWGGGLDDRTPAAGLGYLVRVGTTGVDGSSSTLMIPARYGFDGVSGGSSLYSTQLPAGQRGLKVVMQKETTVYWSVMSVDGTGLRSGLSAGSTAWLAAPAAVGSISAARDADVETSSSAWVKLTFTSPGEDGNTGDLQPGAVYDIRWSTVGVIDTDAKYRDAGNQLLVAADGPANESVTKLVPVEPGKTCHFALTTKDRYGVRSARSGGATMATLVVREWIDDVAPAGALQGDTTALLRIKLWTDSGAAKWTKLRLRKRGTVPDAAIEDVAVYMDNGDGVFVYADDGGAHLTGNAVFSSSQATLSFQTAEDVVIGTKTYFVGVRFVPDYLLVDGSTLSVSLDGEAFTVKEAGFSGPDFPAMNFDGNDDRAAAPFGPNMNVSSFLTLTMEAWVKTADGGSNRSIITRGDDLGGYRLWLNGNASCGAGVPTLLVGGSHLCAARGGTPVAIHDGRWHHVAATYDKLTGAGRVMYVDGEPLDRGDTSGELANTADGLGVGASSATTGQGFPLSGQIDEVRISRFVRYSTHTAFTPSKRLTTVGGEVVLYHFDSADTSTMVVKDVGPYAYDATLAGGATGYGRSSVLALSDAGDVLASSSSDITPQVFFPGSVNAPLLRLKLWTNGDFATLQKLSVAPLGTAAANRVNSLQLWRDDGDDVFNSSADQSLLGGLSFTGGKATFSLVGAGIPQTIGPSTQTYFISWNVLPGTMDLNKTLGLEIPATSDLVLAGGVDAVWDVPFPLQSAVRTLVSAEARVVPETATGTWVNVSSIVFRGNFGTGNVDHFHYIWDRNSVQTVSSSDPEWLAQTWKTTMTATVPEAGDWYFHVRAFDGSDTGGTQQDFGPYLIDVYPPSSLDFRSFGSLGSILQETEFSDLSADATAQVQVRDQGSGLNLSSAAPLAPSLGTAGLWHLDETSGSSWQDATHLKNNLNAAGTVSRGAGRFAAGVLLEGNGYLVAASTKGLPVGGAVRSVEAWVNTRSTSGTMGILAWGAPTAARFGIVEGRLAADLSGAYVSVGPSLSTETWHHAAFTYDGALVRFYLDGQNVGSGAFSANTGDGTLYLGTTDDTAGQRFKGTLDEVRVYAGLLSDGDVAADYANGNPYWVSRSTDAGNTWRIVTATAAAAYPRVELSGTPGSVSYETFKVFGLDLVNSTSAATGAQATNQVRFHSADDAGNVVTAGPYAILVDTNITVAVSTGLMPANGSYVGTRTDFRWTGPSTAAVSGMGGWFYLEASRDDPAFGNIAVRVSTPASVPDPALAKVTGVYVSTYTLDEGTTYYWRVRSRNRFGVFGPWSAASSFVTDVSTPTAGEFLVWSSTEGLFAEGQHVDLLASVTAQFRVRDVTAGLASYGAGLSPVAGTRLLLHFNETEGSAPKDAGGMSPDGQFFGTASSATYALSPLGAGVRCLTGQGVSVPNDQLNFAAASDFTLSAWVKPMNVNTQRFLAGIGSLSDDTNYVLFLQTDGTLNLRSNLSQYNAQGAVVSSGTWQHVAVTAKGNALSFYVNGRLLNAGTAGFSGNKGPVAKPFSICSGFMDGGEVPAPSFNGYMDEVRVLDYVEDAAQIAAEYEATRSGRFAVEFSSDAGNSWAVVTVTAPVGNYPFVTLGGVEGSVSSETVTVQRLTLAHSTTSATGGKGTNQLRLLVTDRGGNFTLSGPYAVVIDTVASAAVSTPSAPSGGVYVSTQPNFVWAGPSTKTVTQMGSAAAYILEVDDDPGFLTPTISISTPVFMPSTSAAAVPGLYFSTFTLADNTTYYWRVRARDFLGIRSHPLTIGNFVTDRAAPAASGFITLNSTGGAVNEGIVNDLLAGVTAQIQIQEAGFSGLATAPVAGLTPFGAIYTSNGADALPQWNDGSWGHVWSAVGESTITVLKVFQGKLYAGTDPGAKVYEFDGDAWTLSQDLPDGVVQAFEEFDNKLYAGLSNGDVWSFSAGSWALAFDSPESRVNTLHAYRGRLYAGTGEAGVSAQPGRIYVYDPASGKWSLDYGSPNQSILSLEVYNNALYAAGYPGGYVFNGSTWTLSAGFSAAVLGLQEYGGKLYAATNDSGKIFTYDGIQWLVDEDLMEDNVRAIGLHAGRLYAAAESPSQPRIVSSDGKDWMSVRQLPSVNDRVNAFAAYQGRLYVGTRLDPGNATVMVSTPLPVSLTGDDGTLAPQTLTVKGLNLAKSANSNICGGSACSATNQIRFTAMDRAGNVKAAGPYAILVDALLRQPTAAYPAAGEYVRFSSPTFGWVEVSSMPKHGVQVSLQASMTPLSVDLSTTTQYLSIPSALQGGTTYYWWVRALNSLNVPSAFSEVRTFVVDAVPPAAAEFTYSNSTGGMLGPTQTSNLAVGVTVQMAVQDTISGLPSQGVLPYDRAGLWHFEEAAGLVAYDASGAGRHGTLSAAGMRGEGAVGRALFVNGTTGRYVDVSSVTLDGSGGLTAAAWVMPTVAEDSSGTILSGVQFRLESHSRDGLVRYQLDTTAGGGCVLVSSQVFPTNIWTHVAFTMHPSGNKLYVNGTLTESCGSGGTPTDSRFRVGKDGVSGISAEDPFEGGIDEVRLFSRVLSAPEIDEERRARESFVLISTDAGGQWDVVSATFSAAGPFLSFAAGVMRAENLALRESTSTAVCAGTQSCGATNQVQYFVPDRSGNVRAPGIYSIAVDTSIPLPAMASLTPVSTTSVYAVAGGTDNLVGLDGYQFEASTWSSFAFPVTTSPFVAWSSHTFTDLLAASTYYVRVRTRDAVGNVSTPSVAFSTSTFGTVFYSTEVSIPANAPQSGLVPMARIALNTPGSSKLYGVTVRRTGTASDTDVPEARLYKDMGNNGVFIPSEDVSLAGAAFVSSVSVITLGSPQLLTVDISTYFVVFVVDPAASVDATVGLEIPTADLIVLQHPHRAEGPFPTVAGPVPVSDGANDLRISHEDRAPDGVAPGTQGVYLLKLNADTNMGTSLIDKLAVRLTGSLEANRVTAVNLWRDANASGDLDVTDERLTNGNDLFDPVTKIATMTLTAQASSRTVTVGGSRFFVSVDLAANADQGATFQVRVASASAVVLSNPADTVVLKTEPIVCSTVTVQQSNVVTFSPEPLLPVVFYQGERYAVMKATLTVSAGFAGINRVQVDESGTAQGEDVAAVEIYKDGIEDGGPFNPGVDVFLGSAAFSTQGQALVDIATQTLSAGATDVLFVVYRIHTGANPGRDLGVYMANETYIRTTDAQSTVAGPFPINTPTALIQATVNKLLIPTALSMSPSGLEQGAQNKLMLQFGAVSDKNDFVWSALKLQRLGTGAYSDVSEVNIYKDDGATSGVFDSSDTLITGGADTFGSDDEVNIPLTQAQTVGASTQTYFVTLSVSAGATPDTTLGIRIATASAFNLSAPNVVSDSVAFPKDGNPVIVRQFPNTVSVATASIVPVLGAEPGIQNVGMMRLELKTDVSEARWYSLKLEQVGSASDSEISAVKVYYDSNDSGQWDSSNMANYELISSPDQQFGEVTSKFVTVSFFVGASTPPALVSTPRRYFVVVDLATGAVPGRTVALRAIDESYFQVNPPNQMDAVTFQSASLTVNAPPAQMHVLSSALAPGTTIQGATNVAMASLKLWMSQYTGAWDRLTVSRYGTGADSDVSTVKLFRDANANGQLEVLSDERLSTAAFSGGAAVLGFPTQTISASTKTYFVTYDVAVTAAFGNTIGAEFGVPSMFNIAAPNSVASAGFPIQSGTTTVSAAQTTLLVQSQDKAPVELVQAATNQVMLSLRLNTPQHALVWSGLRVQSTGTASNADISAVHIWKDVNGNGTLDPTVDRDVTSGLNGLLGGEAYVSLAENQAIGTTPQVYFLAVDVAPFAIQAKTFGLVVASSSCFSVSSPNLVSSDNFPLSSTAVPLKKLAEQLVLSPTSVMPSGVNQGSESAVARLTARASRNNVGWTQLRLLKAGTLGDPGFSAARLYRDLDDNGAVSAADLLVGSAPFATGQAAISFSSAQSVGVSTQGYLVTFVLNPTATVDATVGFTLPDAAYLTVSIPDSASPASLPFSTALGTVLDSRTPTMPTVTVDGACSSNFEALHFTWASSVALGTLTGAYYAVGTTPGGTDVLAYTALGPAETDVSAAGFPLLSGTTYYVSVKTLSSFGFFSPVGNSIGVLMDFMSPAAPALSVSPGETSLLLSWSPVLGGASGIMGYLIEYRTGQRPVWLNAKTRAVVTGISSMRAAQGEISVAAVTAADVVTGTSFQLNELEPGTVFVRMRTVTNSGVVSEPSAVTKVVLGTLPKDAITSVSSYPNPFDSRKEPATIHFVVPASADVSIKIFSVFGRLVKEFGVSGVAGSNEVKWDGSDQNGKQVSKGMYLAVLESGGAKSVLRIGVIH